MRGSLVVSVEDGAISVTALIGLLTEGEKLVARYIAMVMIWGQEMLRCACPLARSPVIAKHQTTL